MPSAFYIMLATLTIPKGCHSYRTYIYYCVSTLKGWHYIYHPFGVCQLSMIFSIILSCLRHLPMILAIIRTSIEVLWTFGCMLELLAALSYPKFAHTLPLVEGNRLFVASNISVVARTFLPVDCNKSFVALHILIVGCTFLPVDANRTLVACYILLVGCTFLSVAGYFLFGKK